ncbi:MAG TPA: GntR family transcriptional regulator [Pyrinomonadaceae bacterium]|jgi:DNA-binding transcriptional regulator YhcF (GntR family)
MPVRVELKALTEGPVYLQVRNQIAEQIRSRAASPGETLPTPAALARELSVDKGEIQRAYYELEQSKLLKRTSGKDFLGKEKTTYTVA